MAYQNKLVKMAGGTLFFSFLVLATLLLISTTPYNFQPREKLPSRSRVQRDNDLDCRPKCRIPSLVSGRQFYSYFAQKEYQCENLRWFGEGDGRKAVCTDAEFNLVPGDCHILSFGINDEWSFDDAFARLGCKVYSFDPTMAKEDHQRSENVQFFRLGIGNMKGKRKVGMDQKFDYFEVDTYEHILDRLGLSNTTIDYLKMDVELSELDFLQDVLRNTPHLLKNIKQIGMELHHG
ncbi:probable methyltransferase-like protein 24 [Macrobrachium rosenbergii]|uniref:probable methyltransferase-like protein 24 n=1 Tax=Macrobrachium rosenbergii TaxID=79674 RepID=UPI0034D490EC